MNRKLLCMLLSLLLFCMAAAAAEGDVRCNTCGQTAESMHRVSSDAEKHILSCACGNLFEQPHAWSEWRNTGDGQHERICTAGCWAFEHCAGGEASCVSAAVCATCGSPYGTPDAQAHAWDEGAVTQPATCRAPGMYTYTCLNDAAHQYTQELPIDPEAHFFRDGVITQQPTCHTEGVLSYTCLYSASHVVTHAIPVDPEAHRWDAGVVTQPSDCVTTGIRVFTCLENPEHTRTEDLPLDMTAHVWGERVLTRTATCEEAGEITLHCSRDASHTGIETIPAIGHSWSMNTTVRQPTCTERGITRYTCQNDPTHTREESIPARGHNWGNMTIVLEPTCTTPGEKEYTCTNDSSHTTKVRIPAEPSAHHFVETEQIIDVPGPCKSGTARIHICEYCGAENAVLIFEPEYHVFSAWTDEEEDFHQATCSRCGNCTVTVFCHDSVASPCPICRNLDLRLSSVSGVKGQDSQGTEFSIAVSGGGGLMYASLYQQSEGVVRAALPTGNVTLTVTPARLSDILAPAADSIAERAVEILAHTDCKVVRSADGIELRTDSDSVLMRIMLYKTDGTVSPVSFRVQGSDVLFTLNRSEWRDAAGDSGVTIRFDLMDP